MKLTNTLALCLAATLIWNCNESTKPEADANNQLPAKVDGVLIHAARTAGYQISSEPAYAQSSGIKFNEKAVQALKDAGICENFITLIEELDSDSTGGPRFSKAIKCIADEVKTAGPGSEEFMFSFLDKCLCDGSSGSIWGNFAFTRYSAPSSAGGKVYGTPVIGTTYAAPTITGYSAPKSAGGTGYSAP